MGDVTEVTGIILSAMPVGEYDRRIVMLTKERGKISAFAKGARRPGSSLMGVTRAFVCGSFQMYEGRTSYTVKQADISEYFESVTTNLDSVYYACYFAELADYYGREGLEAAEMLNLLYLSLKALDNPKLPNKLVRYIYEIRLVDINGECPDFYATDLNRNAETDYLQDAGDGVNCAYGDRYIMGCHVNTSSLYALQYIVSAPLKRLYTFNLSDECMSEVGHVASRIVHSAVDKHIKSEEMLDE